MSATLEVVAVGPQVLIQDLGRPGHAALGVGRSGAADRGAHRLAARLLSQDEHLAGLEVLLGGLGLRALAAVTVCLTGAPARATVDGRLVAHGAPLRLAAGAELMLSAPTSGLRTYLAVRGGLAVPAVLGSRSTDTLAGLGPAPVEAGDLLPVGPAPASQPHVDQVAPPPVPHQPLVLRVAPGPRADWLADDAALTSATWEVTDRSDRVGTRLAGPRLSRATAYRAVELASEPMVRGAIQVPGDGQPVIFGADHPVTGGYPVVGVLRAGDADRLAQAAPGTRLRLVRG